MQSKKKKVIKVNKHAVNTTTKKEIINISYAILTCFGQKTGELGQAVAGQPREEGRMLSLA
ncbi:Uncharacterized protein BM_BM17611 [Brugia malayi]|uniref:Uncharacterized protein n=1 Tax=Brugia malayi TaxID=6279 RepID=A0A4E9FGT9_BRUMA|nr:Uncharacterized protein BM_BM17611 [Brugia malayi]VIO95564.1 Uncharacterized protein BM_BM17611 [Brugia malayi]